MNETKFQIGQKVRHTLRGVVGHVISKTKSNTFSDLFYIVRIGSKEYTVLGSFLQAVPYDGNDILKGML